MTPGQREIMKAYLLPEYGDKADAIIDVFEWYAAALEEISNEMDSRMNLAGVGEIGSTGRAAMLRAIHMANPSAMGMFEEAKEDLKDEGLL